MSEKKSLVREVVHEWGKNVSLVKIDNLNKRPTSHLNCVWFRKSCAWLGFARLRSVLHVLRKGATSPGSLC